MLSPREKRPDCTPFYGKAVWHIGNNPQERARQRLRVVVCSLAIAPLRFAMTLSRPSRQACSNITVQNALRADARRAFDVTAGHA